MGPYAQAFDIHQNQSDPLSGQETFSVAIRPFCSVLPNICWCLTVYSQVWLRREVANLNILQVVEINT